MHPRARPEGGPHGWRRAAAAAPCSGRENSRTAPRREARLPRAHTGAAHMQGCCVTGLHIMLTVLMQKPAA